jgi:1,2-diacylglycerol 3-alpha-glucosyltransferase
VRIGLMTDAYYPQIGGVSTSTSLLKEGLRRNGHDSFVVTTTDPDQPENEEHVFRVVSTPFLSSKRMALPFHPILGRQIAERGIDLVHTQTEFGIGNFGRLIAKKNDLPHIHTFHTLYEDWLNDQLRAKDGGLGRKLIHRYVRMESRRFCNSADIVIVPTEKTERVLRSYGISVPIRVIPTGIDLHRFYKATDNLEERHNLRRQYGVGDNDWLLLYVGRISQEKQIERLTHFIEKRMSLWPQIHFMLVGAGPAVSKVEEIISDSPHKDRIHYVGPVLMENVPQYYAAADLFLSASQSETQGLTYFEALACGLPLLVQEDACLDGVLNEENGISFHDESSFDLGLTRLLTETDEKRSLRSRAAVKKAHEYGVTAFVNKVLTVYEEAFALKESQSTDRRKSV